MNIRSRWALLIALCGSAALALRLRRKSHHAKQAHKVALHAWENEGGNPAPSSEGSDTRVTTGSA